MTFTRQFVKLKSNETLLSKLYIVLPPDGYREETDEEFRVRISNSLKDKINA
jgi:hypothetical protein